MVLRAGLVVVLLGGSLETCSAAKLKSRQGLSMSMKMETMLAVRANPIRKVVTMLQMMSRKVEEEGETAHELYEKFMCYCKSAGGSLAQSVADAEDKIPGLQSHIEELEATLKQLKDDIAKGKNDREDINKSIKEAISIREKEAAAAAKEASSTAATIASLKKAIAAIEKGQAGAFLQTPAAAALSNVAKYSDQINQADRDDLLAFLQSSDEEYAPSDEILGILKQMLDEFTASLKDSSSDEAKGIQEFKLLLKGKYKEIESLNKALELKLARVGEIMVKHATCEKDLEDTEEQLAEDQKVLANLKATCAKAKAAYEASVKTRQEELLAIADTVKILNDDDTLDLMKKTLPGASAFMQLQVTDADTRQRAIALMQTARHKSTHRPQIDFIALSLRGRKVGFQEIIKMIDDMVANLKKEQVDDDQKKDYCAAEIDSADDTKKEQERSISDLESAIAAVQDDVVSVKAEIDALEDGIRTLDKEVAEATENRKEEHEAFVEMMASNSAAKEILKFAKNRLNKFYNPKLYKPPPKRELTEAERITVNNGGTLAPTNPPGGIAGTGVEVFAQLGERRRASETVSSEERAPAVPSFDKGKKSEESNGVLAMVDLLIKDLDKEMTEGKAEEENAQNSYEQFMADSQQKRAEDAKALTSKEVALGKMEKELDAKTEEKASTGKLLEATLQRISALHNECDWLAKFYDTRKEARASEIDALGKAKAVLSGSDYSLLQTSRTVRLRGR